MLNKPKITIETMGRLINDKGIRATVYINILDGSRVLEFGNCYDINTMIESWIYPHNLNGISNNEYLIGFTELLNVFSVMRLETSQLQLPWYVRIKLLIEDVKNHS